MTETTFDLADVERLATALDALDLDEKDRATLHAVFALAGRAAAGEHEDEVSGYLLPAIRGGLLGSFQGMGDGHEQERVKFTFQGIDIGWTDGGKTASDDWSAP